MPKQSRTFSLASVAVACLAISLTPAVAQEINRSVLCGPKCINYIMEHYGKHALDPLEMTTHLEDFDNERGTTMRSIALFLEQHGLKTRLIYIGRQSRIDWPNPVVVHLETSNNQKHFVTRIPDDSLSNECVSFFDGVSRIRRLPIAEWRELRSGYALLTSTAPIPEEISPTHKSNYVFRGGLYHWFISGLAFVLGSAAVLARLFVGKVKVK